MRLATKLNDLVPRHSSDWADWEAAKERLNHTQNVFWYGGSGFDFHPLIGLRTQGLPESLTTSLGDKFLYLMSDYSPSFREGLERLYDELEDLDPVVDIQWRSNVIPKSALGGPHCDLSVEEMILLEHPGMPQQDPQWFRFAADAELPDPGTASLFVYMVVRVEVDQRSFTQQVLFCCVENLRLWQSFLAPNDIRVTAFCALRVAGKSGSWMDMHDPDGPLMAAIARSAPQLRPDFWVTDRTEALERIWDPGYQWLSSTRSRSWRNLWPGPQCKDGYGLPQTFRCDWEKLQVSPI